MIEQSHRRLFRALPALLRATRGTMALVLLTLFATCKPSELTGPPSPAVQLVITRQPVATAGSGAAFAQQPVIQLQDVQGNPVSQVGVVVTAEIIAGGGALGGTITATTDASGQATFVDLSITGIVGNRTLNFSAPAL